MTPYAVVVVNIHSIRGVFHYSIPENLNEVLSLGHYVTVPFGNQIVQGVVIEFADHSPVAETKTIKDLIDPEPVINPIQIDLAKKISQDTHNPLAFDSFSIPTNRSGQSIGYPIFHRVTERDILSFRTPKTFHQLAQEKRTIKRKTN